MKKKIVTLLLAGALAISSVACGGSEDAPKAEQKTEQKEEVKKEEPKSEVAKEAAAKEEAERDFPQGEYSELGNGKFSIQTEGGDSAEGITPVLFVTEEDVLIQIGYSAEAMDGSHLSYIYIDGMENAKEQLGEMVQGVLDLQEDALSKGIHTVEVVQYDTDEPSGNIITYKTCQYEVK